MNQEVVYKINFCYGAYPLLGLDLLGPEIYKVLYTFLVDGNLYVLLMDTKNMNKVFLVNLGEPKVNNFSLIDLVTDFNCNNKWREFFFKKQIDGSFEFIMLDI